MVAEYRLLHDGGVKGFVSSRSTCWLAKGMLTPGYRKEKSNTGHTLKKVHSWIYKCHQPSKYSPKGRVNLQRCQIPQMVWVNRHHSKENCMILHWLSDLEQSHVHAFSWIVDCNKHTFPIHPPTRISMYNPSWKQVHTSGSQTPPGEWRKSLHPPFPLCHCCNLHAQ